MCSWNGFLKHRHRISNPADPSYHALQHKSTVQDPRRVATERNPEQHQHQEYPRGDATAACGELIESIRSKRGTRVCMEKLALVVVNVELYYYLIDIRS